MYPFNLFIYNWHSSQLYAVNCEFEYEIPSHFCLLIPKLCETHLWSNDSYVLLIEVVSLLFVWTNGTDSSSSSSSLVDVVVLPLELIVFMFMWFLWSVLLNESFSSSSIDGVRINLMVGRSPFAITNDAGRPLLTNWVIFEDEFVCGNCVVDGWDWACCWNDIDGRFSLKYSTTTGWFCMIDTRRSVFLTLPECLRMESRRAITGELATDGHALIDGNVKSLRSVEYNYIDG